MKERTKDSRRFTRRSFIGIGAAAAFALTGCATTQEQTEDDAEPAFELSPLPDASPDPESDFGVDANVNIDTIDGYLAQRRGDIVFRDMRLLNDPANYAAVGGNSQLDMTIEGFKITPFPYIGTLSELPVEGAYVGERLFDIEWASDGSVASATPRFAQSMTIVEDLFPRDKHIALMCGGAGYAAMMKALLVYLGWDASRIYNIGGAWFYTGNYSVQLISFDDAGEPTYYLWRADAAIIDFTQYERI